MLLKIFTKGVIFIKNNDNIDMHIDNLIKLSEIDMTYLQKLKTVRNCFDLEKIKTRKDGRVYIYINRKQIVGRDEHDLIEKLYALLDKSKTLRSLYPDWEVFCRKELSNSEKTIREHRYIWNNQLKNEELANKDISELRTSDFLDFFRKITRNQAITKQRFKDIQSVLNGMMKYAVEKEYIKSNVITAINIKQFKYKPTNSKITPYTIEERKQIINLIATKEADLYDLAIILDFQLIMRIGELKALKFTDISGGHIKIQRFMNDKNIIFDHVKGNADEGIRWLPLTKTALNVIQEAKVLNPDSEYIFIKDGRNLTTVTFNRRLKKYCEELGIDYRSSHKVRFSTASIAHKRGMEDVELQGLLGHTSLTMTRHYLKNITTTEETTRKYLEALA